MTITLNGRDWSVDDFRDYRRNQPKAPDAAEVPAFPDGVFGDLLVELGQGQTAAAGASAHAAAAQASAADAASSAIAAEGDAGAADAARLAAQEAATAAQTAVGGVRVSAADTAAGPLGAKIAFSGATVEVLNPGADEVLRVTIDAVDTVALETNLAIVAMRQLVSEGWALQGMVDGVVDEFTDATGIDGAASSDALVVSGYVTGQGYGADVTSGKTAYASASHGSAPPTAAIDDGLSSVWFSDLAPDGTNQWWAVDLGETRNIVKLRLRSTTQRMVRNFKLQKSTNSTNGSDGAWTDVLTGIGPTADSWTDHVLASTSSRWWRVYIIDTWPGQYVGLAEVELLPVAASGGERAFTVTSAAFAADAIPSSARLVLRHQPIGAVVLGTDLIVEASRDNGATWTAGTPIRQATIAGIDVLTADIPLSGQPSGLSMRWRVRTTSVEQRLHALSIQW